MLCKKHVKNMLCYVELSEILDNNRAKTISRIINVFAVEITSNMTSLLELMTALLE